MDPMEDLYQEIILDHYRKPLNNAAELAGEHVHVHHSNPLCGDEMDLRLRVVDDRVDGLVFSGEGCSISQASASVMTDVVLSRSLSDALDLTEEFRRMMHGDAPSRIDDLKDAVAFTGVAKFPVRVKCALLGWMALKDAVETFQRGAAQNTVTYNEE
jgi:nitrogen fixation protein NifU and related proteins